MDSPLYISEASYYPLVALLGSNRPYSTEQSRNCVLRNTFAIVTSAVLEANSTLLPTDAAVGEVLNIESTDTIQIETLAEESRHQFAPDLNFEYAERLDADIDHTYADVSAPLELLGNDSHHSIREGVVGYLEWYRENRDWYEPLVLNS